MAIQPKKPGTPPLKAVSLGDLLTHPFPRREHLLTPWLRQGESAMVWAATGLGKTMLTLSMALAIAGGGGFLGWDSPTPRRVLVIDGEMHAEDLRDRLAMLRPTINGLDTAAAAQNLSLIARQFQGPKVAFPDLAKPEGQEEVLRQITSHGAELVILDNFATLAEVQDENEASAMTPVLTFLLKLKQAGVACILVHHSGKTGADFRGSSKLSTTFEVILGLKAHDEAVVGSGATFTTAWTKFRGAPHPAVRDAIVKLATRPDGVPEWTATPAESDGVRALLEAVRSGRFSAQKDLAAHLGVSPGQVTKLKARAVKEARITNDEWSEHLMGAYADSPGAAF